MTCGRFAVFALLGVGYLMTGGTRFAVAADEATPDPKQETSATGDKEGSAEQKTPAKRYRLQNVTIPPDCSLRSQDNITNPPSIFVQIRKNGEEILKSTTEKGWDVDFPKNAKIFAVDDPDAVYTIQIWDDCWWNQHICNITGLSSDAFAGVIYQKGGQYDTKERLLSVQFKEVPAP